MGLPFCCAQDVSQHLPRVHTRMLLPRSSRGVFSLLQPSSVTQPLRPGAPQAVALCRAPGVVLRPAPGSPRWLGLAESCTTVCGLGTALPTACVGRPERCSPGSWVVCEEPWLLVEQEHVLQMPLSTVVQAALQGWEPHRSLGCSGFPLSPDSALGDNSSLGDAPAGRRGWQRRLLEAVVSPSSARG